MNLIPRRLAHDPYIRALGMRVYPVSSRSMIVVGGTTPHEVFALNNRFKCDCTAASFGRFCAHVAAVEYLYKEHLKGNDRVSELVLDKSSSERGKPVNLPRKQAMLYGGLFSGWFILDGQYGISVGLKALTTHTAAGRSWEKLEQITESMTFVSPRWWYNAKKREASPLMQFVHALTGAEYETLESLSTDQVKKILNENIGTGILFSASVTEKNGVERNTIAKGTVDQADASFGPLAVKMNDKLEIKETKGGDRYIAKPEPVYQDAAGALDNEDLDDEVPF